MSRPAVDVSRAESPPMPAIPESNAHLAPVAPQMLAIATEPAQTRPLVPEHLAPYMLAGSVIVTLAGQELLNPAPWDRARVGSILVNLGGLALAWFTKAPQVSTKPKQ